MSLDRFSTHWRIHTVTLCALLLLLATPVSADRSALLVNANNGAVLYAENALRPSYPASLAKLMTIFLVFEAIEAGTFSSTSKLPISATAAAQPPVKLGLKAGQYINVEKAITALIVMSANDVAVVVAEAIAGSHGAFVDMMNAKAKLLGMSGSRFRNASGLPDPEQITTARDMAFLATALLNAFPTYYQRFAKLAFEFNGRHIDTHNNFLRSFNGAEGLKTGFTCKAGFNLVASASRGGKRLIGVVLGAASARTRDARMTQLMKSGFDNSDEQLFSLRDIPDPIVQGSQDLLNQTMIAEECINPQRQQRYSTVKNWTIEFGVEVKRQSAIDRTKEFITVHRALLKGGKPLLIPRWTQNVIYQLAVTDLTQVNATNTCLSIRNDNIYCVVRSPKAANYAMERARRVLEAIAKRDPSFDPRHY